MTPDALAYKPAGWLHDFRAILILSAVFIILPFVMPYTALANEIVGVSRQQLAADYEATRARLLAASYRYWWEVNGLITSYCDEGVFLLNTTTLQVMLSDNPAYV